MRRISLGTILSLLNLGVVLVVAAVVGSEAVHLLRRLADEQALARVSLARSAAAEAIHQTEEAMQTSALLLAERPTLKRLLDVGDRRGLEAFLDSFARTSRLDGCAVLAGGRLLARSRSPISWEDVEGRAGSREGAFALGRVGDAPLLMGARAPVRGGSGTTAMVALLPDAAYAREVSDRIGLPVTILEKEQILAESGKDPRAPLRFRALEGEASVQERVEDAAVYLSVAPLSDRSGTLVGIVEVALPTEEVDASVRILVGTLLAITAGIGSLAVLIGLVMARRLVRPLARLTEASARIGRGDLTTLVHPASGAEIGTLAESMEEMRTRILNLATELRRRQAEAEAILTGIADGVFSVDRERRIRYVNPQATALLGVQRGETIGRFCGDVLRPDGAGGERPCEDHCPILDARFRGSARAREVLSLRDGRRRTVVITSACAETGAKEGGGGADQFQVMTDESEADAGRRIRDAILANISHEFKTPLSAQLASIELLRDRLPDLSAEEIQDLVHSLERGTLRLTRLVENLLESTRIESGKDTIRRQPVALDQVVEEAVELIAPLIEQRGQDLSVDLPYPLPAIRGDAARLTQVFVNLLANSNKFAPSGTTIRVGGAVSEEEITLWVEDQGPGLPSGASFSLFEPYTRSAGEEPDTHGMGLGLWIVKSIVERHGGRIGVRSGASGTRMDVILPREKP